MEDKYLYLNGSRFIDILYIYLQKNEQMHKKYEGGIFLLKRIVVFILFSFINSSCSTNRNISYFNDVPDSLKADGLNVALSNYIDPKVKPNDILQISIQTLDPQNATVMGLAPTPTFATQPLASTTSQPDVSGYLVDKDGIIELPLVGKIVVKGMTTTEIREAIHQKVSIYYKEPVVNVRYVNFEITVLGEVTRPAKYIVPNEKVNLLDALSMAGDLTVYAKRENVMVIRDENGQKKIVRFDLSSSNIFNSPYFYLRQGDIVYVEPGKSKLATTDAAKSRIYSLAISAASVLVIILTRINF